MKKFSPEFSIHHTCTKFLTTICISSLCLTSAFAATNRPYVGVTAGISIVQMGSNQVDRTQEALGNGSLEYQADNNISNAGVFGLNGGYEFAIGKKTLLALGLGVYQTLQHKGDGKVWWNLDNSYYHIMDYSYKVQNLRLMLEAQLTEQMSIDKFSLNPFISVGVGPSWNDANSYEETIANKDVMPNLTGPFRSNTKRNIAYQIGFGISMPFNADNDRISLGYRYVDLGEATFSARADSSSPFNLNTGSIKSNEIYLSYTRLF